MRIDIKTIPHSEQRYPTCGDFYIDEKGVWNIRVSEMSDWRYEFLVGFHELFEMAWCVLNNVSADEIDEFDMAFEKGRQEGDFSEPGDDPHAPYRGGHVWATVLERIAAAFLRVKWEEYELEVNSL